MSTMKIFPNRISYYIFVQERNTFAVWTREDRSTDKAETSSCPSWRLFVSFIFVSHEIWSDLKRWREEKEVSTASISMLIEKIWIERFRCCF